MNSVELEIGLTCLLSKLEQAVALRFHRHRFGRPVELLLLDRRHREGRFRQIGRLVVAVIRGFGPFDKT